MNATAYTLQAVGKGQMAGFEYRINQANARSTEAVPTGWTQPEPEQLLGEQEGRRMLKTRRAQGGLTLVELMVTLTIFGALLLLGLPSFSAWLQNSRIRVTSEAVLAGLQFAKAEAVARNARVRFQLTDTLDNSLLARAPRASTGSSISIRAWTSPPSRTCAPRHRPRPSRR